VPGDWASLPLTQLVLADAVGLTPIHVNRTLRWLRRERIVCLLPGIIQVLCPAKFARLAGVTDEAPEVLLAMARPSLAAHSSIVPIRKAASA